MMFCPRCGQQAAEGVSFCSRCGLPLDAAAALVESGSASAVETAERAPLTPRQRGARKGLIILIAGLLFFAIAGILTTIKEDLFVLLVPAAVVVVIGVMRMLYGLLLEEHAPPKKSAKLAAADSRAGELPPARSVPASVYAKAGADTSDMAAPPSITESTTRLLEEEEGGARRAN
jgi:hypothetical protein